MARIENTSGRTFHLSLGSRLLEGKQTSVVTVDIPPQTKPDGVTKVNGVAEVDDKLLAEARKGDPVVKGWFDSGDLVVTQGSTPVATPDANKDVAKK